MASVTDWMNTAGKATTAAAAAYETWTDDGSPDEVEVVEVEEEEPTVPVWAWALGGLGALALILKK